VANATLFGYFILLFMYRYSIEVYEEQIYLHHFAWGLLVGFVGWMWASIAWMHWSCTHEFVIGFKSVEELYPSFPLGVDSADTSQCPRRRIGMDSSNTSK
jgi:hypothetical protein